MAENEIRPSRYVSPQRDYQPRQAYRRPGSDLSRVPSRLETEMSETKTPESWAQMNPEQRRDHIVELIERHGPMRKGKVATLLRVKHGTAAYKALDNSLQLLKRAGRLVRRDDHWLLPTQTLPRCTGCGETEAQCLCQAQPKPAEPKLVETRPAESAPEQADDDRDEPLHLRVLIDPDGDPEIESMRMLAEVLEHRLHVLDADQARRVLTWFTDRYRGELENGGQSR